MIKQKAFKNFVLVLSFVAFLSAGYLAVNVATSCQAQAQLCGPPGCSWFGSTNCIYMLSGWTVALGFLTSTFLGYVTQVSGFIMAYTTIHAMSFYDAISAKIDDVREHFLAWFDSYWHYYMLPMMQQMARQLTVMGTDQARAIGSFYDAANEMRVDRDFKERQMNTHREQRPGENVCVAATVTGGMTRAASFRRAYNVAAPTDKLPRSGNTAGTPAGAGTAADISDRWGEYVTRYCRKDYNDGVAGCTVDGTFVDKDIDVAGTIFAKDTIDLKDTTGVYDVKKNIDDLITNIAEPFVREVVSPGAIDSATGREAILAGESYKAKRQVIYDALYHIVSRRAAGSVDPAIPTAHVAEIRQASGILPCPPSPAPMDTSSCASPSPSHNEVMQALMVERFRSGFYGLNQIDEPENNQRELVIHQALQLMQLSDQLDLMDRYSLLLAAQAGAEVKASKNLGTAAEGAPK